MKRTIRAWAVGLLAAAAMASSPVARAVPVSVDLTNLRAIQTYAQGEKAEDQAYLLVDGFAGGKAFSQRVPADKVWTVAPKSPVASMKEPVTLWKGDLNDGESALVTVTLVQGKNADDVGVKDYQAALSGATKGAESAKVAAADDAKALAAATVKAEQDVVRGVKKNLSHDTAVNHFGGLFNVLIWNQGGKVMKRVDPVGLTFGEHYGTDPKVYTKIKNTRGNVMVKDDATGEWSEQQMTPLSDDEMAVRVKMLETEAFKGKSPPKHTTDYLAEIQVKAEGKPLHWELGGDHPGPTDVHEYWDFAK